VAVLDLHHQIIDLIKDMFNFIQIKAVNSLGHEYIIFEKELA